MCIKSCVPALEVYTKIVVADKGNQVVICATVFTESAGWISICSKTISALAVRLVQHLAPVAHSTANTTT